MVVARRRGGEGCGGEEEGEDGEEVCVRLLRVLYESEESSHNTYANTHW